MSNDVHAAIAALFEEQPAAYRPKYGLLHTVVGDDWDISTSLFDGSTEIEYRPQSGQRSMHWTVRAEQHEKVSMIRNHLTAISFVRRLSESLAAGLPQSWMETAAGAVYDRVRYISLMAPEISQETWDLLLGKNVVQVTP